MAQGTLNAAPPSVVDQRPPLAAAAAASGAGAFAPDSAPSRFLKRTKYLVFVIHNATFYDLEDDQGNVVHPYFCPLVHELAEKAFVENKITYFIAQSEECPKTRRIHIQGYVEGPSRSFDIWRKVSIFSDGDPWIRDARGSGAENRAYCSKEESFYGWRLELGHYANVGSGSRTDIVRVKRLVEQGVPELDIWRDDDNFSTMLRFHKGIDRYRNLLSSANAVLEPRNVFCYWGPTHTGKSYRAMTLHGSFFIVPHPKGSGIYFDGYNGQESIIFDEFNGSRLDHSFYLEICGNAPVSLPVHGGFIPLSVHTRNIIFCSGEHPYYWYKKLYEAKPHLWPMAMRRFVSIEHCTEVFENPTIRMRFHAIPPPPAPEGVSNEILFHL